MVFCKDCKRQVDLCSHFVYPIEAPRVSVFDPKIETLAYSEKERILEIVFKSGQVWQLLGVPPAIYMELRDTSITSFLRFIAQRYKSVPVRTGLQAIRIPESESCPQCQKPMSVRHRIDSQFDANVRVLWECPNSHSEWRQYGGGLARQRKGRWH
jgi:KTSC domain-containing protein